MSTPKRSRLPRKAKEDVFYVAEPDKSDSDEGDDSFSEKSQEEDSGSDSCEEEDTLQQTQPNKNSPTPLSKKQKIEE